MRRGVGDLRQAIGSSQAIPINAIRMQAIAMKPNHVEERCLPIDVLLVTEEIAWVVSARDVPPEAVPLREEPLYQRP